MIVLTISVFALSTGLSVLSFLLFVSFISWLFTRLDIFYLAFSSEPTSQIAGNFFIFCLLFLMGILISFKAWFVVNINIEILILFMTFRATLAVLGILISFLTFQGTEILFKLQYDVSGHDGRIRKFNILYDVSGHRDLITIPFVTFWVTIAVLGNLISFITFQGTEILLKFQYPSWRFGPR